MSTITLPHGRFQSSPTHRISPSAGEPEWQYPGGYGGPQTGRRTRAAHTGLTFLIVLVRAGPGACPVLRVALGPRRLLLLGARTLAEVDPLGQARQVLRHGQRLQVRLSAIQAHLLDLLLAGGLDADPHSAHSRHAGAVGGRREDPPLKPKPEVGSRGASEESPQAGNRGGSAHLGKPNPAVGRDTKPRAKRLSQNALQFPAPARSLPEPNWQAPALRPSGGALPVFLALRWEKLPGL